jgi:porphobilinogen deaminase
MPALSHSPSPPAKAALALWQAEHVKALLQAQMGHQPCSLLGMTTQR